MDYTPQLTTCSLCWRLQDWGSRWNPTCPMRRTNTWWWRGKPSQADWGRFGSRASGRSVRSPLTDTVKLVIAAVSPLCRPGRLVYLLLSIFVGRWRTAWGVIVSSGRPCSSVSGKSRFENVFHVADEGLFAFPRGEDGVHRPHDLVHVPSLDRRQVFASGGTGGACSIAQQLAVKDQVRASPRLTPRGTRRAPPAHTAQGDVRTPHLTRLSSPWNCSAGEWLHEPCTAAGLVCRGKRPGGSFKELHSKSGEPTAIGVR